MAIFKRKNKKEEAYEEETEVKEVEKQEDETEFKIQEEIDLEKLRKIYQSCGKVGNDTKLVEDVSKILNSENGKNENEKEMVRKIVARRIAWYYIKISNAITVNRYVNLVSPLEMLECDMPARAEKEFKSLITSDKFDIDIKEDEMKFDVKTCRGMIIDELANSVASQYLDQNPSNRVMIIPESSAIRKFTTEEEKEFINQIAMKCKNKNSRLKKHQIQDIKNQIHGYVKTEEVDSLKTRLEAISSPNLKRKYARGFESIVNKLQGFPEADQEKIMTLLVDMTGKVAEKVKGLNSPSIDDSDER